MRGEHHLLLDLDVDHWYSDSTTPGHAHLAINVELDVEALKEIVAVLTKYGILQNGIQKQLDERGHLSLRMPGQKKGSLDDLSLEEAQEWKQKQNQKN